MSDDPNASGTGERTNVEPDQFERWCIETGRRLRDASHAHVEVYVRSLLPPPGAKDAQTRVLTALEGAVEETPIEDVIVEVWGERLCRCEACRDTRVGRVVLDTVRAFERWGEEFGASVDGFFEHTRQESSLTGSTYEGIVPPRVTAALYVDGTVSGVFPCRFGTESYSVGDFCEAMPRLATVDPVSEPVEFKR